MYSFPGGRLRHVEIAATAGNVDKDLSPGANIRWLFLYGFITLVCDATAANRVINCTLEDGSSNALFPLQKTGNITAGQTRTVAYSVGVLDGIADVVIANFNIAVPSLALVEGSDKLAFTVANGVAGDSYSGYITVLEVAA